MTNILLFKAKRKKVLWAAASFVLIALVIGAFGIVDYLDENELTVYAKQPVEKPAGTIGLEISIHSRTLTVYVDGNPYKKYAIAVGKKGTPTPVGEWRVIGKDYNWGTGFGTRWMGLNVPWGIYGIHGTNKPWSIGRYASHGCIRMRNRDVEELFEWVPVGTIVKIVGPPVQVSRVLKYKISGPDVVVLQAKLKELGFYQERADGIFGISTEQSVKNYQQANGLEASGVVDPVTKQKLGI